MKIEKNKRFHMKDTMRCLGLFALVAVIGFSMAALSLTGCDTGNGGGGGGETPDIASFAGTWNASGGRSIVFTGNNFTYIVNGTAQYSGTFSVSGSTITFNESSLGTASGNFSLSSTTLNLSNHTWDNSVNGTYTKGATIVETIELWYLSGEWEGGTFENWEHTYKIPSSVTGGQITKGDIYTFTYSFTFASDVASDKSLRIRLVDSVDSNYSGFYELSDGQVITNGTQAGNVVRGTKTLIATRTASSTDPFANGLQFAIYDASEDINPPTLIFTEFTLVKSSSTTIITLEYMDGGGAYEDWYAFYNIPSSVTGGRITEGDVYTFTYSFTADKSVSSNLGIEFVDVNDGMGWTGLSNTQIIANSIGNTVVSGSKIIVATRTASSTNANANSMRFIIWGATNHDPITLTFTEFSLVKGSRIVSLDRDTGDTYDVWSTILDLPSSIGKVTEGDTYTFTYSLTSNIAISNLWMAIVDNSATAVPQHWKRLSDYVSIYDISANTEKNGAIDITATFTASAETADANRLSMGVDVSNAASAPTLTFTTFSWVKGGGGDTPVTFSSLGQNGASTTTTTHLTLTFSAAIAGLSANDITLSGVNGVVKGTLSQVGSTPVYTLPISGFTSGGTLSVSVSKTGYAISGSPKSTAIYYYSGGDPNAPYIITGSGSSFTATKNGATVESNQLMRIVIDAIRTNASGAACTIQFGSGGSNVLDIGTTGIEFNNDGGTWGNITLNGKITSSYDNTVSIRNNVTVISTADIEYTSDGWGAFWIGNGGALTINGGTLKGNSNVVTNAGGTVTITSGFIDGKRGVHNQSGGTVTITGGTVKGTEYAVYNSTTSEYEGGTVTIYDPPAIINGNTNGPINWIPPKGSGGSVGAPTVLDGTWQKVNTTYSLKFDGNTWTYANSGGDFLKGTWISSKPVASPSSGTVTLTATQIKNGSSWQNIPSGTPNIVNTADYSLNAAGNELAVSNAQLSTGDWQQTNGVYRKQ